MLARAELGYITQLHNIGRQLTVLKHIYESYDQVIGRVLQLQNVDRKVGPTLAPEAINRFERLRHGIRNYALSEIQDCLDEKESMAFMVNLPSYLPTSLSTSSVHVLTSGKLTEHIITI